MSRAIATRVMRLIIGGIAVAPRWLMPGARVVVAGAGLAGLSAARELARAGAAVTLIDARDYAGGRVRTVRDFADGQHAELGGEFVERDHKELIALCNELGLRLTRVLQRGFTHRFRDRNGMYRLSRTGTWQALADALAPLVRRYKAARGDTSAAAVREMATMSLRESLRQSDAGQELHSMATALRGFFLADAEEISVLPVVEQIVNGGSPSQAALYRIDGGNDRLVDALLRSTPARVLLRTALREVAHATDRVVVTVSDADGRTQQLEADFAVMTLPAATLRGIAITPALPDVQRRAIERLSYGRATKALVQSPAHLFGRRHARAFATDTCLGAFWDAAEEQGTRSSIVAFLGGGSASALLRDAAARGGHELLSDLCWLGMNRAPIAAVRFADWTADPWALGGYAFIDPGFDPAWRPLLARRAGRLLFAGEHTSERWQGYMNGAVESGQRAARELLSQ